MRNMEAQLWVLGTRAISQGLEASLRTRGNRTGQSWMSHSALQMQTLTISRSQVYKPHHKRALPLPLNLDLLSKQAPFNSVCFLSPALPPRPPHLPCSNTNIQTALSAKVPLRTALDSAAAFKKREHVMRCSYLNGLVIQWPRPLQTAQVISTEF